MRRVQEQHACLMELKREAVSVSGRLGRKGHVGACEALHSVCRGKALEVDSYAVCGVE